MGGFSYGGGASDPLILAASTAAVGQIQQPSGTRLVHTYAAGGGSDNLFIGISAGNFTLSGATGNNIGVGGSALDALTSGYKNIAIGKNAGGAITDGLDNTLIGDNSGSDLQSGYSNVLVGNGTGANLTTNAFRNNVGVGLNALKWKGSLVYHNVVLGQAAASANIAQSLYNSVVIGDSALSNTNVNSDFYSSVIVGSGAGNRANSAAGTIAIGYSALGGGTGSGTRDFTDTIVIGREALSSPAGTTFAGAIAIGYQAFRTGIGNYSVAIGYQALDATSTGAIRNVGIGKSVLGAVSSGTDNTAIGELAGDTITTGSKNTFIGSDADGSAVGRTNATAVGYKALAAADNVAVFGAANGSTNANGELNATGVGTASPTLFWQVDEICGMTDEGGFAVKLTNKTGANSVKGTLVSADTTANDAVKLTPQDGLDTVGIMYSDGVANGTAVWVVVSGRASVKFGAAVTRGQFARMSITGDTGAAAGIATAEAAPTTPFATDNHFREVGHVIETTGGAGLAKCIVHFN